MKTLLSKLRISRMFSVWTILILVGFTFHFTIQYRWESHDNRGWERVIDSDGRGYYGYLPAVFIYKNLKWEHIDEIENKAGLDYPGLSFGMIGDSGRVDKYPAGVAVLLLPFFLLAWIIAPLAGFEPDGYSKIFQMSVSIGAMFYLFLGLFWLRKLLRSYGAGEGLTGMVMVLLYFGTNLCYYTVMEPSISHVYSFCIIGGFLYFSRIFFREHSRKSFILMCVLLGLTALVRPTNVMVVLLLPFAAGGWASFVQGINLVFKNKIQLAAGVIVFAAIVFIQPLLWYLQTGLWFVDTYPGERFDFLNPQIFNFLFSYKKGLFIYTPLAFLGVLSFIAIYRQNILWFWNLLLFWLFFVYFTSSWWSWWYGGSFSTRPIIDFYSVFAVMIALLFLEIKNIVLKTQVLILTVCAVGLNLVYFYQYRMGIIHFEEMTEEKFWNVFMKFDPARYAWAVYGEKVNLALYKKVENHHFGFEEKDHLGDSSCISEIRSHSGRKSSLVNSSHVFNGSFVKQLSELDSAADYRILVEGWVYVEDFDHRGMLVMSFENEGKIIAYKAYPFRLDAVELRKWHRFSYSCSVPQNRQPGDMVKIYATNFVSDVYVDDLTISILKLKE